MRLKILLILLVTNVLFSCSSNQKENIVILKYSLGGKLMETSVTQLVISKSQIVTEYNFEEIGVISVFSNNDDFIMINGHKCLLTDSIKIESNEEVIIVKKYHYDKPESIDEETNYFLIDDYGPFIIKSEAWGYFGVLKRPRHNLESILEVLLSDSSGFLRVPPPPRK